MSLRTDMPSRSDARPGTSDDRDVTVYDPERGGWYPTGDTPGARRDPEPLPDVAPA